jgi:preprotein translocase subunit SecD
MIKKNWLFVALVPLISISLISCRYLFGNKQNTNRANIPGMYMEIKLEPIDSNAPAISQDDMTHIKDVMERRISALGVASSEVTIMGQIIQIVLPGYMNLEEAKNVIGKTGELLFKDENGVIIVSGKSLQDAKFTYKTISVSGDQESVIELTFDEEGTRLIANGTKANIGKSISISLDGEQIMSSKVNEVIINGKVIITSNRPENEEKKKSKIEIASILKGGSIPAKVIFLKAELR